MSDALMYRLDRFGWWSVSRRVIRGVCGYQCNIRLSLPGRQFRKNVVAVGRTWEDAVSRAADRAEQAQRDHGVDATPRLRLATPAPPTKRNPFLNCNPDKPAGRPPTMTQ